MVILIQIPRQAHFFHFCLSLAHSARNIDSWALLPKLHIWLYQIQRQNRGSSVFIGGHHDYGLLFHVHHHAPSTVPQVSTTYEPAELPTHICLIGHWKRDLDKPITVLLHSRESDFRYSLPFSLSTPFPTVIYPTFVPVVPHSVVLSAGFGCTVYHEDSSVWQGDDSLKGDSHSG